MAAGGLGLGIGAFAPAPQAVQCTGKFVVKLRHRVRMFRAVWQGLALGRRSPDIQLTAAVQDDIQCSAAPDAQRQQGGNSGHRHASIGVMHDAYPDAAHDGTLHLGRRSFQRLGFQPGSVAVQTAVAVGQMFGGFQPPQLIQLACDQGVKAFFGQTSVFWNSSIRWVPLSGGLDWAKICCASIFLPR